MSARNLLSSIDIDVFYVLSKHEMTKDTLSAICN